MGTSTPRSNVTPGSAGSQVITPDGGGALRCIIDAVFSAHVISTTPQGETGLVTLIEQQLELVVDDIAIARLEASDGAQRLRSCMARGHRYVGVVTGPRAVHLWNAP